MNQQALIIGAGIGGLAAACLLGKAGYQVTVLEKNEQLGGRLGTFTAHGFTFDTGPSWYLMPDVFTHFFEFMDERLEDYLQLVKLSPSYRVFYKESQQHLDITSDLASNMTAFERWEPGAGGQLQRYLSKAQRTYEIALQNFMYTNYDHPRDLLRTQSLQALLHMPLFSTLDRYASRYFHDPRLQKILVYPSIFLGVSPYRAPAIYSMLSHADCTMGVYYPRGGMYKIVEALVALGKKHGVRHYTKSAVEKIMVENGRAVGVIAQGKKYRANMVISDAGLHHTETQLLAKAERDHSARYWQKRVLAPSAVLLYIGLDRQYPSLAHHNLLFSEDWRQNFNELYGHEMFPSNPSLYVCAPSKTDPSVGPAGKENLFVLVPVAAGLRYTPAQLESFAQSILATMEKHLQMPGLCKAIVYKKLFCVQDFATQFNSYKGTGLGLAHTLTQTAFFRPHNISKKVTNLYYVGADVHPGIGIPSTLISAELLLKRL